MSPQILAAAAVCRVVLGDLSANVADALAAVEAWASDADPFDADEAKGHYKRLLFCDLSNEAAYWLVSAVECRRFADRYVGDCLATLALIDGWTEERVNAMYAAVLAGLSVERSEVRDTIPAPEPEREAA